MLVSVARVAWVGGLRLRRLLLAIGFGMDFGNALLLVSTVFLVVELANQLLPGLEGRWKVLLAIVAGQASAWVVANSDWGSKQLIDGLRLDLMNGVSLILVGLALAGVAVGFKQALKSVANIGENRSETP